MHRGTVTGRKCMILVFSQLTNNLKLLLKLTNYGIKGNTLNWIKSFLIGRFKTIVLDGESSKEVPVTSVVPQGSVLGPLLFLLYINDLPDNIQSQVWLFADDIAVYLTVSSANYSRILQSDLDSLQCCKPGTWNLSPVNARYSSSPDSEVPLSKYYMHDQELETVDSAKYLGVNIGADLSWNLHISKIDNTANRTLGFVKMSKQKIKK